MKAEKGKQGRKPVLPPRNRALALLLGLFMLSPGSGQAQDYPGLILRDATEEVEQYARRRGWVNFQYAVAPWVPGNPDQLPTCDVAVQAERATRQPAVWGRIPYTLRCTQPEWELRARAEVSLIVPIVVARRNIARDDLLDRNTMKLEKRDLASVYRDFVTDTRLLSGQRARRSVRAGQPITLSHAVAPLLVERGDQVVIRVEADGVYASMTGEALQDGSRGEGIRVRNHSSGKIITAWVIERGIVETRF